MRKLLILFLSLFIVAGCGDEIETISLYRAGTFTFNVEGYQQIWRSDSFKMYPGQSVVKEFPGDPSINVIFRRYYLVFSGTNPDGNPFELALTVDMGDQDDLRHIYSRNYHRQKGGLHDISLIITEKGPDHNIYKIALLNDTDDDFPFFEIERQNNKEKLIAGSFDFNLTFQSPASGELNIFNGIYKDIKY